MSGNERVRWLPGDALELADYRAAQSYRMAQRYAHGASLHVSGIAQGLAVKLAGGGVTVDPGLAIDALGRSLIVSAPASIAPPPSDGMYLTLSYRELPGGAASPQGPQTIEESPLLAWQALPASGAFDPRAAIPIARWTAGAIDATVGRYSGMNAGEVAFVRADRAARDSPSIRGFGDDIAYGLQLEAPRVVASGALVVRGGHVGIGTMSPGATFELAGPNTEAVGPGTISSFDKVVTSSDVLASELLHAGDIIITTDRQGRVVESKVVRSFGAGRFETEDALDCRDASFTYRAAMLVRFATGGRQPVLVIDSDGRAGVGTESPSATRAAQPRLTITGGDIVLDDQPRALAFSGAAQLRADDDSHRVLFRVPEQILELREAGDIALYPGAPAANPSLAITARGYVGVGTSSPEALLDVAGELHSTEGGFVFPDGTIQTTAEIPIPVGAVIDWWRGSAPIAVPDAYVVCDGSPIDDTNSSLHGKRTPNLEGLFVLGVTSYADIGKTAGTDRHSHGFAMPTHTHTFVHTHPSLQGITDQANDDNGPAGASDYAEAGHVHSYTLQVESVASMVTGPNSDAHAAVKTDETAIAPPYIGLLKLMRVR